MWEVKQLNIFQPLNFFLIKDKTNVSLRGLTKMLNLRKEAQNALFSVDCDEGSEHPAEDKNKVKTLNFFS